MTTTITKISSVKTPIEMREILHKAKGSIYAEKHSEGWEVRDLRILKDRLTNPFRGKGIKRYFGETHLVVTDKLLSKFDGVVFS